MVKKLIILVVLVGLGWSGWWFWSAQSLRTETERWFSERRADGWEARYDDLTIRGFPNRLDTTFTTLALSDPDRGTLWQAPFFQVLQLSYKPGHMIAVWPPEQVLRTGGDTYDITSEGLRASLVTDGDRVLRANAEASVINITPQDGAAIALAGLKLAIVEQPDEPQTYRIALTVDAAARSTSALTPLTGDSLDALSLDATVTFDRDLNTGSATAARPQPTRIDLRLAEYNLGALQVKLAGKLKIDDTGRPDGKITLKAVNWRDLIALARDAGHVPPGLAGTLEQGLGLMAQLSGNPNTLDLPLTFARGRMSLGPISLGAAPRLRLP